MYVHAVPRSGPWVLWPWAELLCLDKAGGETLNMGQLSWSAVASMGRTAEMLIECTGCDRPKLFATTTMAQADISYTLTFEPVPTGTRMRWVGQVPPKGAYRLLGSVITWQGYARSGGSGRA
jgi:hypothetical protein